LRETGRRKDLQIEELQKTIEMLKNELEEEREKRNRELESEFEKLAQSQVQIKTLNEKQESLLKEIEQLKSHQPSSSFLATSPRVSTNSGNIQPWRLKEMERQKEAEEREKEARMKLHRVQSLKSLSNPGNIPQWRLREIERQKEMEEQREKETRIKLQKVQSLKLQLIGVIPQETENENFKDPLLNKPAVIAVEESDKSAMIASDTSEQDKIDAELARISKTFKRGSHSI